MDLPFMYVLAVANISNNAVQTGYLGIYVTSVDDAEAVVHLPWMTSANRVSLRERETFEVFQRFNSDTVQIAYEEAVVVNSSHEISIQVTRPRGIRFSVPAYTALPLSAHSTDFFLAAYGINTAFTGQMRSYFVLANGPHANTVTVTKGDLPVLGPLQMAAYRVLHWRGNATLDDVTGLRVTSEKPLSVFAGHPCAFVWIILCEPLFQQMPPVQDLGKEYLMGPIKGRDPEAGYTVRVVLAHALTSIYVGPINKVVSYDGHGIGSRCSFSNGRDFGYFECDPPTYAGDFIEFRLENALLGAHVTCSKPCMVMQYNHGQDADNQTSDPFMTLVPPAGQIPLDGVALFHTVGPHLGRSHFSSYINVIVPHGASFTYDGVDRSALTGVIKAEYANWDIVAFHIEDGGHVVAVEGKDTSLVVQVYGHGLEGAAIAYGFPATYCGAPDATVSVQNQFCTTNTCQNQGSCLNQASGYICVCQPMFTGPTCEISIVLNDTTVSMTTTLTTIVSVMDTTSSVYTFPDTETGLSFGLKIAIIVIVILVVIIIVLFITVCVILRKRAKVAKPITVKSVSPPLSPSDVPDQYLTPISFRTLHTQESSDYAQPVDPEAKYVNTSPGYEDIGEAYSTIPESTFTQYQSIKPDKVQETPYQELRK